MANKFGPTRGEIKFRLYFSVCALLFMGAGLVFRGLPLGPAGFEVILFGTLFFGGTLVWGIVALRKKDNDRAS